MLITLPRICPIKIQLQAKGEIDPHVSQNVRERALNLSYGSCMINR
jgi:hypothetical protein